MCNYAFLFFVLFLCMCVFLRALQAAQSGGHKTLLYGHAILLRHSFSSMVREGTPRGTSTNPDEQDLTFTASEVYDSHMNSSSVLCLSVPGLFEDVKVADG